MPFFQYWILFLTWIIFYWYVVNNVYISFCVDGSLLFSGSRDNCVRLWDVTRPTSIGEREVSRNLVWSTYRILQLIITQYKLLILWGGVMSKGISIEVSIETRSLPTAHHLTPLSQIIKWRALISYNNITEVKRKKMTVIPIVCVFLLNR